MSTFNTAIEFSAYLNSDTYILEKPMHISLTTELESRIKSKVESGLYNNASEVIREALYFMDTGFLFIKK
jgi:hypothetical protein